MSIKVSLRRFNRVKVIPVHVCHKLQRRAFFLEAQVNFKLLEKLDGPEEIGIVGHSFNRKPTIEEH